jgi:hypothetical protein
MQALTLLLTNLLLLAVPADKPKAPSLDVDAVLEQVSALEPAKQQEWLRHLKLRLDRATALSLPPAAAAKKKAQYEAQLTQKTISRDTLRELLRLADAREKTAIDVLTRQYRVQVYETFWTRQEEYKERQAVLDRGLEAWNASNKTPAQQEQMVAWLEAALKSAQPGAKDPPPADPKFDGSAPPKEGEPEPKEPEEKPATEKPKDGGTKPEPRKPTEKPVEKPKVETPAKEPRPKPADTSLLPGRAADPPTGPRRPAKDDEPTEVGAGGTNRPIPAELPRGGKKGDSPHLPERPEGGHRAGTVVAQMGTVPFFPSRREPLAAALVDPSLTAPLPLESTSLDELAGARPTVAYRPDARGVPQPPLQLVAVELAADASGGAVPPVVSPQRHTTANGRAYVGPLPDEPGHGLGRESLLSLGSLSDVQVSPEPLLPPVHVNVVNLKARIAGCNLTLRELEIELDEQRDWNATSLGPLLERLRDLRQQQNDLAAVRELMPETEQDRVGRCAPLKLAVAQLGRRIFEARTRAADPNSPGTPAARQAELNRLDALSRELAELAP